MQAQGGVATITNQVQRERSRRTENEGDEGTDGRDCRLHREQGEISPIAR